MKNREFDSKIRYLWAFIIGTIIFFLGFFITYLVSQAEMRSVGLIQNQLSYGLFEQKVISSFFIKNGCKDDSFRDINRHRTIQGRAIASMEDRFGKENVIVLERKKFYTLIQVAHLEFIEKRRKECNDSMNVLIFFYSNQQRDEESSTRVGNLLDVVLERNPNLQIYSFDYFLDSKLIELLKEKYSITEYPIVVNIDGEKVINPRKIDEIEELIE